MTIKMKLRQFSCCTLALGVSACAGWLPVAGPSYSHMKPDQRQVAASTVSQVKVVHVNEDVIADLSGAGDGALNKASVFPAEWRLGKPSLLLGAGDGVQVSLFEAPPAVLLSSAASSNAADLSIGYGSGVMNLPEQIVSQQGTIVVPFAGEIPVAGKTLTQVEQIIRARLSKIANQPQVVARLGQNAVNSVVVVADGRSIRMPLTAKGERILDALPLAGDAKRVKGISIRLTRNGQTRVIAANALSQSPQSNIYLQPGDVLAILQDPYRITVLGASNANAAVDFGEDGLTVAEAIGRVAGLNDFRADPRGIYVFRRGQPEAGESVVAASTVYQVDVRNAQGMLLAQNFKLRDKDMVYISNAPSVQLQKILNMFNTSLGSAANVATVHTGF